MVMVESHSTSLLQLTAAIANPSLILGLPSELNLYLVGGCSIATFDYQRLLTTMPLIISPIDILMISPFYQPFCNVKLRFMGLTHISKTHEHPHCFLQ